MIVVQEARSLDPEQRFMRALDNPGKRETMICTATIVMTASLALTAFALYSALSSPIIGISAVCLLGIIFYDSFRLYSCCQIKEEAERTSRKEDPHKMTEMAKNLKKLGIDLIFCETKIQSQLRRSIILESLIETGLIW